MKREFIAMIFMVVSITVILIAASIFGEEVVFDTISRYIVVWLLVAFYVGQYSMKFPKKF
jgi:hypothetical protein